MEAVNNHMLPCIEIYCSPGQEELARFVGYGIEEEGLPYQILPEEITSQDTLKKVHGAGLGVIVLVEGSSAAVYTRQLKELKPLFFKEIVYRETAKMIGKNAARIVKNKPFLDLGD